MITKYICKNKSESNYIFNIYPYEYTDMVCDTKHPISLFVDNGTFSSWCELKCDNCIHYKKCDTFTNKVSDVIIVSKLMRKQKIKRIIGNKEIL